MRELSSFGVHGTGEWFLWGSLPGVEGCHVGGNESLGAGRVVRILGLMCSHGLSELSVEL
jgi:hypothetical protein